MAVLVLGPAGCGFKPVYSRPSGATSSAIGEQLAAVRVLGIEDRTGQQLRNALITQLNPRGEPARNRYTLEVKLQQSSSGQASSKDGNATIESMTVTATYTLTDFAQNKALTSGQVRSVTSFRYLGPRYASTAAERDSETSAVQEIATEVRSALIAYFTNPETFQARYREDATRDTLRRESTLEPADNP